MTAVRSQVSLLANVWKLLEVRHDVDDIIFELLGRFSLEKVYSECDTQAYQRLVISLLARLNAIYSLQRLSLPSKNEQVGQYLGFLVSWEVIIRSVEFVLQIVIEGREAFWAVPALRDKYLAELLSVSLRILMLHPKPPGGQWSYKERRDRFARIHGLLEKLFDNYPDPKSFLLSVCKEITDVLRTHPDALDLPTKLRYELPNVATQMYPLPDCLTSNYIFTIVEEEELSEHWLAQFLALRDISHFVVGASIQRFVQEGSLDAELQASCTETRNAVFVSLDGFRIPQKFSKLEMIETFSEIFRAILPDTLSASIEDASRVIFDEEATDAIDAFSLSLHERQVVHRVSDVHMMGAMSSIKENVASFVDGGPRSRIPFQRAYALNCSSCHFVGHHKFTEANNLTIPDPVEGSVVNLPERTKCLKCAEEVTVAREISLVWQAWNALKPVECNTDTIGLERHSSGRFQLQPKAGTCMPVQTGNHHLNIGISTSQEHKFTAQLTPSSDHTSFLIPGSATQTYSPDIVSPISPEHRQLDSPIGDTVRSDFSTINEAIQNRNLQINSSERTMVSPIEGTLSPTGSGLSANSIERSISTISVQPIRLARARTLINSDRSKGSKFLPIRRKEPPASSAGDTSSLSSGTLDRQKMEEISLKELINASKVNARGSRPKNVNVYLSQNSTHALFWTQSSIHVWDVGMSPPSPIRAISAESSCLMAAVTKTYLAYVIGTRDQKLTLRIVNLVQATVPVLEYRMPATLWCRSMAISPQENYVVIGLDNATVLFFRTVATNSEQPRKFRLHLYHKECKNCPSVDTLSFSLDGIVLLASTRDQKLGMIQLYMWSFPFLEYRELTKCRYLVPLHESEDNGVSAALYRPSRSSDEDLVCISTWTQSGVPLLVQPENGHRAEIKPDGTRRLGNRIQCAAFSPSGNQLGLVNDRGYLYQLSNLNSSIMECRKLATTKQLTSKSESFAMSYMSLHEEESIVLAWIDMSKAVGYIKKVPITSAGTDYQISAAAEVVLSELPDNSTLATPVQSKTVKESGRLFSPVFRHYMSFGDGIRSRRNEPAELAANDIHSSAKR